MQDSSKNPFIPQESASNQQRLYKRQSPLGRVVKWSMIATFIIAVMVGVGLYYILPKTSAVDQQARTKLADTIQPPDQMLKRVAVESSFGFKLNYDNHVFSSYAEVGDSTSGTDGSSAIISGQTYENNDLRVSRAYNYVRIRPVESVESARALEPQPPQLELFATLTDKDLTTAAAVPENKGLSKLSLFVKLDGDKRLAKRVADDKTVVTIDVSKPVGVSIGSVDYQKVRYTTTNDNHRVSNVKYDDCYYTIQQDQPYSICITGVRPTSVSAASLVEQVFNSITFEQTTTATEESTGTKTTSYAYPLARLAQATTTTTDENAQTTAEGGESALITVTPKYYNDGASLSAIAMTQPSVVRIGTLYCSDLTLKFESGETATNLTDACAGNVASGVFISKDGYVATTGHAIRSQKKAAINGYINFAPDREEMLDRLQRILDYLLKAKIILQSDADYLKTGAQIGDQEALAKVQNISSVIPEKFITPVDEEYTYAIQPTDKPIVINRSDTNKPSFAYSDSVLKAKFVAANYDATKSVQEVFDSETPTVDVGLLKVDGDFPDVPIIAKEDVKADNTLNTVGFSAYTDSSLAIDKVRNLPVVTQSKVDQAYVKEGTRLIQTDNAVLPGNDGAPVIDNNGQLVGFAVYGLAYCPDQQCFGNGTVRSSSELLKLLDDNNIRLTTGSPAATNWRSAVAEYMRANYSASASGFATAGAAYPFNQWASPLEKLAVSSQGTPLDTSLMNQLQIVLIAALVGLAVLTLLLAIALFIHRRRIDMMQVGHYGGADTVAPVLGPTPTPSPMSQVPQQPQYPANQLPPVYPQQQNNQQDRGSDTTPIIAIRSQPTPQNDEPQQGPKPVQPQPPSEDPFYKQ